VRPNENDLLRGANIGLRIVTIPEAEILEDKASYGQTLGFLLKAADI